MNFGCCQDTFDNTEYKEDNKYLIAQHKSVARAYKTLLHAADCNIDIMFMQSQVYPLILKYTGNIIKCPGSEWPNSRH